ATHEDNDHSSAGIFESFVVNLNAEDIAIELSKFLALDSYEGDILIQEHLHFDYSGVIFSSAQSEKLIGIEYSTGNAGITSGQQTGNFILFQDEKLVYESSENKLDLKIWPLNQIMQIETFFNNPIDIEFGIKGRSFYHLQSRLLSKEQLNFLKSLSSRQLGD